ncbi:MAG: cbb3-type cytochrome c oxidase subunit I [Acidimicrobiales bacterium]
MTMTDTRPDADDAGPLAAVAPDPAPAGLLTTSDHKRLGLAFLGGALLFLLVGGVVGMVMRGELVGEGVQLAGGNYRRLFGLHATVSTLLVIAPAWIGLASHVVPLQIGAGRLAFPRLHAFALWTFLMGGALTLVAYVIEPPAGFGLSSATPVPAAPGGADETTALMIAGVALVAVATLLAAWNLAVTVLKLRAPGLTLRRLPMFSWATLLTSLVTLLATPVFLAGLVLFYLDQRFGGALFAGNAGGRAIWQHTLWLFGRPEIYLLLLPGLGAACDIVSTHAGRPLISQDGARAGLTLFALLSLGAWAAGRGVADALVLPTYSVLTALVAAPVGLIVLVCLGTLAKGRPRFHVSLLFVAGFVLLTGFGALHALVAAVVGVDGEAWTTGNLHTVAFGPPLLLLVGGLYHWAPKLFGRQLSDSLGRVVFLALFGGFLLMGLGSYLLGYDGAPAGLSDFPFTTNGGTFAALAAVGGVLVIVGVLVLGAEILRAAAQLGGSATSASDPYDGLTLEWATSSPPPPHSFDMVPEVRSAEPMADLRRAEAATAPTGADGGTRG